MFLIFANFTPPPRMLNVAAEMKTVRRDLTFLEMELEQLMKGDFEHFMLKEIFEQVCGILEIKQALKSENLCSNAD